MGTEDYRTACHESGHVLACRVLGIQVSSVMVTRTAAPGMLAGSTCWVREPLTGDVLDALQVGGPLITWPWPLRERIEAEAIVYLAGDEAEHLLTPRFGHVPDPVSVRAAELVSDADREWAGQRAEHGGDCATDGDAARLAGLVFLAFGRDGNDEAIGWMTWLRAATRSLVLARSEQILRLAEALNTHGVLGAEGIAACIG